MASGGRSRAKKPPRKQRTRAHILADWSVHHVERFVLGEGWAAERVYRDYGFDLSVTTFDSRGYAEAGEIKLQLKATDEIEKYFLKTKGVYSFPITRADFNLWTETVFPVFFVLYDAAKAVAYWQYVQEFFRKHAPRKKQSSHLQLHLPRQNVLDKSTMVMMRRHKMAILLQTKEIRHG